jgi:hypothetical protein
MARRARSHYILHQMRNSFFLRDLGDERNLFSPLTAMEMVGGELVAVRRFKRSLVMARAASGGAPSLGMALEVALGAGDSPPSCGSVRESLVRRVDDASLLGNGGSALEFQEGERGCSFIGGSHGMLRKDYSLDSISKSRLISRISVAFEERRKILVRYDSNRIRWTPGVTRLELGVQGSNKLR